LSRRIIGVVVTLTALTLAAGCGGNTDTTVRSGRDAVSAAADGADATGVRTVTYQGVAFDVPASWPVYDLAADPSTCVRFDVNAVYLGHPGPNMVCPAEVVGRADAVLVEPSEGAAGGSATAEVSVQSVNGLEAQVLDAGPTSGEVAALFPATGVRATLSYRDSDAAVRQILGSFRSAGS